MSIIGQTSATRAPAQSASITHARGFGALIPNLMFALAFSFAIAIVLGLVH